MLADLLHVTADLLAGEGLDERGTSVLRPRGKGSF